MYLSENKEDGMWVWLHSLLRDRTNVEMVSKCIKASIFVIRFQSRLSVARLFEILNNSKLLRLSMVLKDKSRLERLGNTCSPESDKRLR